MSVLELFREEARTFDARAQELYANDLEAKRQKEKEANHLTLEKLLRQIGVLGFGSWSDDGLSYVVEDITVQYGVTNPPRGAGLFLTKGTVTQKLPWREDLTAASFGQAVLWLEQQLTGK
jgi:hypothetical protein